MNAEVELELKIIQREELYDKKEEIKMHLKDVKQELNAIVKYGIDIQLFQALKKEQLKLEDDFQNISSEFDIIDTECEYLSMHFSRHPYLFDYDDVGLWGWL